MSEDGVKRRRVLESVATTAVGGVAAAGTTTARSGDEFDRPVLARGVRTVRKVPTERGYRREETFEIRSTSELHLTVTDGEVTAETDRRYRNSVIDGVETADLGTEEFRVDEQAIAARLSERAPEDERIRASDLDLVPGSGTEVIEYEDTAVLGTVGQHYAQEMQVKERLLSETDYSAQQISSPLVYSNCSRYTYKGNNPSDAGDLAERTGPINVAWNNGKDASEVESDMRTEWGWGSPWPSGTRYIFQNWSTVSSQDKHIKYNLPPNNTPNQWHIRAYDVPEVDNIDVVGAGHSDPIDHGQQCKYIGLNCDIDWNLSGTRKEASRVWTDVQTKLGGNGNRHPSSEGKYDYIEGEIKERDDDSCVLGCIVLSDDD